MFLFYYAIYLKIKSLILSFKYFNHIQTKTWKFMSKNLHTTPENAEATDMETLPSCRIIARSVDSDISEPRNVF